MGWAALFLGTLSDRPACHLPAAPSGPLASGRSSHTAGPSVCSCRGGCSSRASPQASPFLSRHSVTTSPFSVGTFVAGPSFCFALLLGNVQAALLGSRPCANVEWRCSVWALACMYNLDHRWGERGSACRSVRGSRLSAFRVTSHAHYIASLETNCACVRRYPERRQVSPTHGVARAAAFPLPVIKIVREDS